MHSSLPGIMTNNGNQCIGVHWGNSYIGVISLGITISAIRYNMGSECAWVSDEYVRSAVGALCIIDH